MYIPLGSLRIIKNTDSHFHKLNGSNLLNTICHFEHHAPLKFSYKSPISLRYIKQGEIHYKAEHSHTASALNELFLITQPKELETKICGGSLTEGFSVFFDPVLIRENLLGRLKDLQISVKEPEAIFQELIVASLASFGNTQLKICCEKFFSLISSDSFCRYKLISYFEEIQLLFLDFLIQNYLNAQHLKLQNKDSRKEVIRRLFLGKMYIHENFPKKISLGQIAENAFLSKYCFQRYFKAFFKLSPTEYLNGLRLEKAMLLLKTKQQSIGSIAEQCGFRSPQYFAYSFKNAYGQSPNHLRKWVA